MNDLNVKNQFNLSCVFAKRENKLQHIVGAYNG
ncbi:Uncharacterised protein [Yersinia pekkanenii]|uniref:Uncharacterized protein n=1 Tax=Yersinia pekkanenii TaxID=1288385 RepID=A0A0T9NM60_9GAMM|nr:Uncharacterised protein [Yersinia pekkanenii]CRY66043.1 Uncharacterised protein [Yersinia pekkanenii]